jgi:hypothetical protein
LAPAGWHEANNAGRPHLNYPIGTGQRLAGHAPQPNEENRTTHRDHDQTRAKAEGSDFVTPAAMNPVMIPMVTMSAIAIVASM